MTEEKEIEEILYESHSVGMRDEVMKRATAIYKSEDFKERRVDAYNIAYIEVVGSKL